MENIESSKAVVTEKLPQRFLKEGSENLFKPISEIYNLSISHKIYPKQADL